MAPPVDLVHVIRNGLVESIHTGDVAVCDVDGRVVAFAGDPERALFGRSCEKPVQGAVSFHAMDEPGDLPDDLIAVMCASHNGEPRHVAAVRRLLRRGPVPVSALQNPRDRMRGGTRSRIHDNCSGKHAGMLVASAHRGWDLTTYRSRAHPIQRRVSRAMVDATGVARPTFGVDGLVTSFSHYINDLVIQPDAKIVAAGAKVTPGGLNCPGGPCGGGPMPAMARVSIRKFFTGLRRPRVVR